ncbi:MAG: substrate-binding domain-containing protein [Bacteroidota bacterium]
MIYDELDNAMNELMSQKKKLDALFTSADKLTTNCMRYFRFRGIGIPGNLAIVGFRNLPLTDQWTPSRSIVRQLTFEMGELSAELRIKTIEHL